MSLGPGQAGFQLGKLLLQVLDAFLTGVNAVGSSY